MWLLKYLKEPSKAALNSRTTHKAKNAGTEGTLTSYCAKLVHFIKTYATGDIIYAAENDILEFSQLERMSEKEYAAALYKKSLKCCSVCLEELLKGLFIEALSSNVRQNVLNCYDKNRYEDLGTLSRHT